jgi:hypothetical protein
MSEVIPEDEDRGGDGAIGEALDDEDDEQGGTGADDGGPGSQNMGPRCLTPDGVRHLCG